MAQGEEQKTGRTPASSAASRLSARRTAKAAAKAAKRGTAPIVPSDVARRVLTAKSWYEGRQRMLWGAVAGGTLVVAAVFAVDSYLSKSKRQGGELLRTAVATASAPIIGADSLPPEAEEDLPDETYSNLTARANKARERFASALSEGHLPAAPAAWAKLGKANALSVLGKQADALPDYDQIANSADLPPFVRYRAFEGAGYALEAAQKYAEAATRFEQIGKLQSGAYKVPADYHRARMHIALGEPQKAADLLQAMIKAERARPAGEGTRFSGLLGDAETLLTELSVQLNAPNLRPETPTAQTAPTRVPGAAQGQGQGQGQITEEIVEQLRRQLQSGKGEGGLTPEVIEALARQAKQGENNGPAANPAPKREDEKPTSAPKGNTQ